MGEFFQTLWNQLKEFFGKMERRKLIIIASLTALILVIIIVSISLLSQKNYVVLYEQMDPKEAGTIINKLREMGEDAKPKPGTNDTILVPEGRVDDLRLQLAAENLPSNGYNYSMWEQALQLGVTDSDKRVYFQYQLQENLRTSISRFDGVRGCDVLVNVVENNVLRLDGNKKESSASVQLALAEGKRLTYEQALTISRFLLTAVPNLTAENISITDTTGYLYDLTKLPAEAEDDLKIEEQLDLQRRVRQQLQDQVVTLLNPIFGEDNVRASVNVVLNFDTKKTESVKFDPPIPDETEGIAISLKELEETIKGSAAAVEDAAGFDSNGAAPQYPATDNTDDDTVYNKVSRETNLEINETKQQIDSAKGQIEKLTVAVSLNRNQSDEDFSAEVQNLVSKAVGVDIENVSVERLPFQEAEAASAAEIARQLEEQRARAQQSEQLMRYLIIAGTVIIVAVLVLIMVLSLRKKKPLPVLEAATADGSTFDVAVGDDGISAEGVIESRKSTTRELVEEYIQRDPEAVAHLLRNWLSSDAR